MAKPRKRTAPPLPSSRRTGGTSRRPFRGLAAAGVALLPLILAGWWWRGTQPEKGGPSSPRPAASAPPLADERTIFAQYGGSASCRECHAEAFDLWEGSHHALAERPVQPDRDRGAFDPARAFQHATQQSAVRWSDDAA